MSMQLVTDTVENNAPPFQIGWNGTKPFNLGAMLSGKPVVTRGGQAFKLAGVNRDADEEQQIAGWVDGELLGFDLNGVFSAHSKYTSLNLVMKGE